MDIAAFTKIPYGMFIITSAFEGNKGGQIANTVFQITAEPAVIAVSISKQNYTHALMKGSKKAVISAVTEEAPFAFIGKFGFKSAKNVDKFEGTQYKMSDDNIPVVTEFSNSYFETDIVSEFETETHTVFMCQVKNCTLLNDQPTMTYDYYHKVKKGLTPKNAPTFNKK